ncbi:TIGR01777 family oxidoreductase [Rufibacter glacialis]|uniref:TIGR01777 family oxidoreductase n=1 Tax=Rufibacter glacialis TaxID=1259555 RepID=A0A5M8QB66_9BACT|nr:TIGR01777 family oxidoreductase [Rufibacter glacialis]KAA6433237.1 TIGR01777 family protein [Rufibacter glacialis]GGK76219.1 NAD-dependent epimerase [Rufibacter glacialis]
MAKIILAGGNGFIGRFLTEHFTSKGHEVIVLTRKPSAQPTAARQVYWDAATPTGDWVQHLDHADLLINLTGKSVNCRYTEKNKREIISSRVQATYALGEAIRFVQNPPRLWMNAASATIYRHAQDGPQDELTGEVGTGFSVDVCCQWENAFYAQHTPTTRKIALRLAIVLAKEGGVMPYYLNLARLGLGGRQGNGLQCFSWVHAQDVIQSIEFLMRHEELEGDFNIASPKPIPNHYFMTTIRQALGVPLGLRARKWMLEIGAFLLGTETELLLKSRWVAPARLLQAGYTFQVRTIEEAVALCLPAPALTPFSGKQPRNAGFPSCQPSA